MVTLFKHAVLLTLLFAPSTQYAMTREDEKTQKNNSDHTRQAPSAQIAIEKREVPEMHRNPSQTERNPAPSSSPTHSHNPYDCLKPLDPSMRPSNPPSN